MSSGPAGKFQDHYIVLGVEPNADSDTIQAAYARLTQKYHPSNKDTGNQEKFDGLNQAFEVLADPALRAAFDKVKGVDPEAGNPKFTGPEFFDALEHSALLRSAVLCLLYDRMRVKSFKPSLSMRHMEGMLNVNGEALNFALWYLKKRNLVINDDKSALAITVDGMDFLEQNRPSAEEVMKFIKADALLHPAPKPAPVPVAEPAGQVEKKPDEPVLNALSRALGRGNPPEERMRRVPLRTK